MKSPVSCRWLFGRVTFQSCGEAALHASSIGASNRRNSSSSGRCFTHDAEVPLHKRGRVASARRRILLYQALGFYVRAAVNFLGYVQHEFAYVFPDVQRAQCRLTTVRSRAVGQGRLPCQFWLLLHRREELFQHVIFPKLATRSQRGVGHSSCGHMEPDSFLETVFTLVCAALLHEVSSSSCSSSMRCLVYCQVRVLIVSFALWSIRSWELVKCL